MMVITVICPHCRVRLNVPGPDEGGPGSGASIECVECFNEFPFIVDDEQSIPTVAQQPVQPPPRPAVPTYAERMMAEQLAEQQRYEAEVRAREQYDSRMGFAYGVKQGVLGMVKTLVELTSALVVLFFFVGICVFSFVGGWLVGDELFFFLSKILQPAVRAIFG